MRSDLRFRNRVEAGQALGQHLASLDLHLHRPLVVALPRGGVPVGAEVARTLHVPLDVVVVRKLGHPAQPELGVGAIGEGDVVLVNEALVRRAGVSREALDRVAAKEAEELRRRVARYRGDRPRLDLTDRDVVLVDDGLATGFTARAAVEVLRRAGARRVVLAVPVSSQEAAADLGLVADEVVCLEAPRWFQAIGQWYEDFHQVGDQAVVDLLAELHREAPAGDPPADATPAVHREVVVGPWHLPGTLVLPPSAQGLVLFAHGSGSSRLSPRNRFVAEVLQRAGVGTLLFDLLAPAEERDRANVFDIELLADRLGEATSWCREELAWDGPGLGYFGASTGAAAALTAAAQRGDVDAVVSRGGRPDLAGAHLEDVTAPTLLIVGGHDGVVLDLNRRAASLLVRCEHRLEVVPGATHLFEEPGTLEQAADLATAWFTRHLRR